MSRLVISIVVVLCVLSSKSAFADGGSVLTSAERDGYRITVMASPIPLRAGPVDVSVLVQKGDTGKVVAETNVEIVLRPNDSNQAPIRMAATTGAATNKLFKSALFTLPQPGNWRVSTLVTIDDRLMAVETDAEVAAALPRVSDLWLWVGWPFVAIALFVAHRGLVSRSKR